MTKREKETEEIKEIINKRYSELLKKGPPYDEETFDKLMLCYGLLESFKESESLKPLVMGGYPKLMYNALTPYYQIISLTFLIFGFFLLIVSIGGFFIAYLASMTGYIVPAVISSIFGIILLFFLRKVKQ